MTTHTKFYKIGGIVLQVTSELPMNDATFHPKFKTFEVNRAGPDTIAIHHHLDWDDNLSFDGENEQLYFRPPWRVFKTDHNIIYNWIESTPPYKNLNRQAIADLTHTRIDINTHPSLEKIFYKGNHTSLTMFPSDQILIGRLLAYRKGCIVHSLGTLLNDQGYLFVGHSNAGKSTMAGIMKKNCEILCDDRNIVRKIKDTFMLFGTWSHGDVTDVSSNSAPLTKIFFLDQAKQNQINPIDDKKQIFKNLLACLIRPVGTPDWWNNSLDLLTEIVETVPCYQLKFNKNGGIINLVKKLT